MVAVRVGRFFIVTVLFIVISACYSNLVTIRDLQQSDLRSLGVERSEWIATNEEGGSYRSTTLLGGKPSRGVALVIHGLNIRPEAMGAIVSALNGAEIETVAVALSGHDSNQKDLETRLAQFKGVTYDQWRKEIVEAFSVAQLRARERNVPLFFVGYSIGGLLVSDLILSEPNIAFDRMVLFAPALAIRSTSYFLKLFSSFPDFVIPSYSPESYRVNEGTPMAAYNVLYEALEYFSDGLNDKRNIAKLNVPTLLFVDEDDELVSYQGLSALIENRGLTEWSIDNVSKSDDAGTQYHHLMIDAESLGEKAWGHVKRKMLSHFTDSLSKQTTVSKQTSVTNQASEKTLDVGAEANGPAN